MFVIRKSSNVLKFSINRAPGWLSRLSACLQVLIPTFWDGLPVQRDPCYSLRPPVCALSFSPSRSLSSKWNLLKKLNIKEPELQRIARTLMICFSFYFLEISLGSLRSETCELYLHGSELYLHGIDTVCSCLVLSIRICKFSEKVYFAFSAI